MKATILCLLLVLSVPGFASAYGPIFGAGQRPLLVAADGSWDDFARIRRGEKRKSDDPADSAPTKKEPVLKSVEESKRPKVQPPKTVRAQNETRANPKLITMPKKPTESGASWAFYRGAMNVASNDWYDPHSIDFAWTYAHSIPLASDPRVVVYLHGAGDGELAMWAHSPSPNGDLEVRVQDAGAYNPEWREWWSFSADGVAYPGRRIAAALDFVTKRHSIDVRERGLLIEGASMGGGGAVVQAMLLPMPWRSLIAYVSGHLGVLMPRQVVRQSPAQFASLPAHVPSNNAVWERIDFALQVTRDPIVRGIHYRQSFSTSDPLNEGRRGNTQLQFVNTVENRRIGGAFSWVDGGQWMQEEGVNLPDLAYFESAEQDITLDRAHPAFTHSTGNYPRRQVDRVNDERFPRGHYNMGLLWNHAGIVDDPSQIVFPLRYAHRTNLGKGVPDQPTRIKVSVTPRRPSTFAIVDGESLRWSWDNGALSGSALVTGDTVTIPQLPLVSGEPYKNLRIFRE